MSNRNNLRTMRPGPRPIANAPAPGIDAGLQAQVAMLQQQLSERNQIIAAQQEMLNQGERNFQRLRADRINIAIHLAAVIQEKFGGIAFVSPVTMQDIATKFQMSQMGGFDFEDIEADAIGPKRHRIKMLTMEESEANRAAQLHAAAAQTAERAAEQAPLIVAPSSQEAASEPEVCPGIWHKNTKVPGVNCPACGLRFPRAL